MQTAPDHQRPIGVCGFGCQPWQQVYADRRSRDDVHPQMTSMSLDKQPDGQALQTKPCEKTGTASAQYFPSKQILRSIYND